jgi:DNA polymerase (family X)
LIRNADIARVLEEIADLLELGDENPFRVRAYRYAAQELERSNLDVAALIARGEELPRIQGVGTDLADKISRSREAAAAGSLRSCARAIRPASRSSSRSPAWVPSACECSTTS